MSLTVLTHAPARAANDVGSPLRRALARGDASNLPGRRDEAWRWTDLRGALRVVPPPSPRADEDIAAGPFGAIEGAYQILVVNGRRLRGEGPIRIDGDATIALRFVSLTDATSHACDLEFEVAPNANLILLESYEGGARGYVAAVDLRITLGEGATIERVVIQSDAADAISVSTSQVTLGGRARFAQSVVTTGARLQRHETWLTHPGDGAVARLDAAYVLSATALADLTSVVEHTGAGGVTSQVAKGVVADRARAVFQGRIVVARGADGTDARLRHDALLLSDRAEVDAKPELEIYADDVQCAHGATVGALDEEQLFYIRSRGVGEAEARALLLRAFLGDVVERIEHLAARAIVGDWIAARLDALGR